MSNWAFVSLSFGLTWVVLIGYGLAIHRRARQAEAQLEATFADARAVRLPEPARETVTRTAVEVAR